MDFNFKFSDNDGEAFCPQCPFFFESVIQFLSLPEAQVAGDAAHIGTQNHITQLLVRKLQVLMQVEVRRGTISPRWWLACAQFLVVEFTPLTCAIVSLASFGLQFKEEGGVGAGAAQRSRLNCFLMCPPHHRSATGKSTIRGKLAIWCRPSLLRSVSRRVLMSKSVTWGSGSKMAT